VTRSELLANLSVYQSIYKDERLFVPLFISLLRHPRAYHRDHLPGHMTGSAWIVDQSRQYVLLTHHAKLNRWLQPGGHADGDENIFEVALKEAREETGLQQFLKIQPTIFDIDIHRIPARPEFPEHFHYDVRILLESSRSAALSVTEESHALAWIHVNDLASRSANNLSMLRMAQKVNDLFAAQQ
jgi:8-oxo-dGTP pyrophosphatase MutT (NUDIX family)